MALRLLRSQVEQLETQERKTAELSQQLAAAKEELNAKASRSNAPSQALEHQLKTQIRALSSQNETLVQMLEAEDGANEAMRKKIRKLELKLAKLGSFAHSHATAESFHSSDSFGALGQRQGEEWWEPRGNGTTKPPPTATAAPPRIVPGAAAFPAVTASHSGSGGSSSHWEAPRASEGAAGSSVPFSFVPKPFQGPSATAAAAIAPAAPAFPGATALPLRPHSPIVPATTAAAASSPPLSITDAYFKAVAEAYASIPAYTPPTTAAATAATAAATDTSVFFDFSATPGLPPSSSAASHEFASTSASSLHLPAFSTAPSSPSLQPPIHSAPHVSLPVVGGSVPSQPHVGQPRYWQSNAAPTAEIENNFDFRSLATKGQRLTAGAFGSFHSSAVPMSLPATAAAAATASAVPLPSFPPSFQPQQHPPPNTSALHLPFHGTTDGATAASHRRRHPSPSAVAAAKPRQTQQSRKDGKAAKAISDALKAANSYLERK